MSGKNAILIKVLLAFVCVFAFLSVFFTNILQQLFGFSAVVLTLSALLLIFFSKSEKSETSPSEKNKSFKNIFPKPSKDESNDGKIAVLNRFASIASHDLKNPLASLKNIAYYFANSVKIDGDTPNKMLKMLSTEVDRMNKMIVDLLDSTRVKQLNPAVSDLDVLINEAVEKEKTGAVNFNLNLAKYKANIDSERFKQVISSIIKNSRESMPSGGDISVNMSKADSCVLIEIIDTGKGMDPETLEKCFDPMFSTKTAKALGMSLTVSKQIITMSGGFIKAESSSGNGSKFTIGLPLAS